MRSRIGWRISFGWLANACVALAASALPLVEVSPAVFRVQAQTIAMPTYPASSVKAGHSGVAVAEVHVSQAGTVIGVTLLEAPDQAIGAEMTRALSRWRFRQTLEIQSGTPVEIQGRVILFFSLKNGTPQVQDLVAQHR
jgi:TonB family protein